ncbi:MAG: S41 family peptidase [Candidatus Aminicenantaceae bacterium]
MKRKIALLTVLILVLFLLPAKDEDIWGLSFKKMSSIVSILEDSYFQDIDHEKLAYSSIKGMLQTLDPHSYFLDPDHFSRMREDQRGKYFGLGIIIQKQEDRLVVISPIEGGPAYRLGIQAGDVISHINGESTKPISSYDAMQKLRGLKGTKINITVFREWLNKALEMTIVREEIPLHSVPYSFILQEDIGYIFIRNFGGTTTREFEERMESLVKQGMKKLILDMRTNGGGTFIQSVEISDEFLPKGDLIVSIKGRNKDYNREFFAMRDNQYENIPLVLLINRGSASAPEIVSGAIKDNDRGLIVGENSFGKGLVQTVIPLAPNAAVALTTAKYYTPSGRSIQRDYTHIEDYMLRKEVPEENREVRYTSQGRKVMGQGGISPDYEVKFSIQDITFDLLYKGAFFSYARKFTKNETPLSKKFIFPREKKANIKDSGSKRIIKKNFIADSQVLIDFKEFLQASEIKYDPEQFEKAKGEIKRELEREIFSSIWGIEEGVKVYRNSDPAILKAIEVLPDASKLIKKD